MGQDQNQDQDQVLVFGAGASGLSACRLLLQQKKRVYLVDRKFSGRGPSSLPPDLDQALSQESRLSEEQASAHFPNVELMVLSPGIARSHPLVQMALSKQIAVISEIELGFRFLPANHPSIVAITGANGKTTTTVLLSHLLQTSGLKVFTGGNIGTPLCDLALQLTTVSAQASSSPYEIIVLELSSFQLESMVSFRAHVALILNLVMNHGERYQTLEEYGRAKFHLSDRLGSEDFFYYPSVPEFFSQWSSKLVCHHQGLDSDQLLTEIRAQPWATSFQLPGEHNWLNLAWAYKAVQALGFNWSDELWAKALASFHGVEHRLERVAQTQLPFQVYNDAKSTNFTATWTALSAFGLEKRIALIFGGRPRGGDLTPAQENLLLQRCCHIYLLGETAPDYWQRFSNKARPGQLSLVHNLSELANLLSGPEMKKNLEYEVLLFSPGHPSFDQFTSFSHRGETFKKMIAGVELSLSL